MTWRMLFHALGRCNWREFRVKKGYNPYVVLINAKKNNDGQLYPAPKKVCRICGRGKW